MLKQLFRQRIEILRNYTFEKGYDGLILSKCENFSWVTFGARNYVFLNTDVGEAHVLLIEDRIYVMTNNIEKQRLENVELDDDIISEIELVEYIWYKKMEDVFKAFITGKKILSDTGMLGTTNVSTEIDQMRFILTDYELEAYRKLGKDCDEILSEVMSNIRPSMTELQVSASIMRGLVERNIEPLLILVFGEESAALYRHNLPRNVKVGEKVLVSICARRKGLIISATRSIAFKLNQKWIDQHRKNSYIEARAIVNSKSGRKLNEVFKVIKEAYAEVGFPYGWFLNHQGGLTGYKARELIANERTDYALQPGNLVVWNPTITGTKSEDTVAVTGAGFEILSYPTESRWPCIEFKIGDTVVRRPDLLILS